MKYLIVGGVAGGATGAARLRRLDEQAEIILLEKGKYISYANCGLPYYIGNTIKEREKLFVQTPESFGCRFNVDVRVNSEVLSINPENKTVEIKGNNGETYSETYDKLLLSPGAYPFMPNIEGIDSEGIFTLRNIDDTDKIKEFVTKNKIYSAAVVGAGFIGLEMTENLSDLGIKVSVIEMSNQVMAPVDFSIAAHIHQHLTEKGVDLFLETKVERFSKKGDKITLSMSNGNPIETDMVILSIGVRPDTSLAKSANLKIGETGGIWVNEYLETSQKDIYAVGDAIEYPHPLTGKPWLNYLANPANRQGRIVADNMVLGNKTRYEGAIGTSIAKVFDMTVASTGIAAKRLAKDSIPYNSITTHTGSNAGYYPNATPISTKLIFDPTNGKILGAQCVGFNGIDKRIDQIALTIKQGGTVFDLTKLEHAYAPPFSSAKDPIAIAGYVASNVVTGAMPVVHWRDIDTRDKSKVYLLDVRTEAEFEFGSIEGAINIPVDELRKRIGEVPKDKTIYIFCAVGLRGYLATKILIGNGYKNVYNLTGGYKTYSIAKAPVTNKKAHKNIALNIEQQNTGNNITSNFKTLQIDACGLQCPGPILKIKHAIDNVAQGDRVEIIATDAGFYRDIESWCKTTGNILISSTEENGKYTVVVEKNKSNKQNLRKDGSGRGKTLILFSDDLDKVLATFVLANGAAATGEKVSIFCTFWGLNAIKKVNKPKVEKDIFGKMFSFMLPSSSLKLKLSKMNMGGIGSKMMRYIMKNKNIDSLESLRQQAIDQGVEFIACQMSMDVMGVKKEELMDNVTIGGVATYMERADNANVNLFI